MCASLILRVWRKLEMLCKFFGPASEHANAQQNFHSSLSLSCSSHHLYNTLQQQQKQQQLCFCYISRNNCCTLNYLKIDCNLILASAIEMRLLVRRRLCVRFIIRCIVFLREREIRLLYQVHIYIFVHVCLCIFQTFPKCKNYLQEASWSQHTFSQTKESKLGDLSFWHVTRFQWCNHFRTHCSSRSLRFISRVVSMLNQNAQFPFLNWNSRYCPINFKLRFYYIWQKLQNYVSYIWTLSFNLKSLYWIVWWKLTARPNTQIFSSLRCNIDPLSTLYTTFCIFKTFD